MLSVCYQVDLFFVVIHWTRLAILGYIVVVMFRIHLIHPWTS